MERSALLSEHRSAGARLSTGDPPVLLTYGDVPAEYRAGVEGCALFDETDRGGLVVTGADAVDFLHRLLSSDVRGLRAGSGHRSLLLTSKGKVLFDFHLFRDADRFWISAPPGTAGRLAEALETYHFSEKVSIDSSVDHAPVAVCGPDAAGVVSAALGTPVPEEDHAWVRASFEDGACTLARVPVAGSSGLLLDAGAERAPALWRALRDAGARPAGVVARDSLRVEAGAALFGVDVDENVYPQEARLESAFSLEKGCYVGQEVVAKIDTYGGLNKRLVALRVSHDDPVPRGTRLSRDVDGEWRELGLVTSWAYSFELDGGILLGFVKRDHQDAGTTFRIGETDGRATVVRLPIRSGALPVTGEPA